MTLPVKLQNDEKVVREVRRHPAAVTLQIVGDVIVAILLILLINWLSGLVPTLSTLWNIAYVVVILGALLIGLVAFYRYHNDVWLITNQRIVNSVKSSPFNHCVSSTDLINVQDIAIQKKGILATTFNFGDVVCQTASTKGNFTFRGVPNPTQLLEEVDRLRDEAPHLRSQHIVGQLARANKTSVTPRRWRKAPLCWSSRIAGQEQVRHPLAHPRSQVEPPVAALRSELYAPHWSTLPTWLRLTVPHV